MMLTRGGHLPRRRGRPSRGQDRRCISLWEGTMERWNALKMTMEDTRNITNSEFADFLMDNMQKTSRRSDICSKSQLTSPTTQRGNQQQEGCLVPSTPFGNHAPRKRLLKEMSEPSSIDDSMVDITGITNPDSLTETATWILAQNDRDKGNFTVPSALCFRINPHFGSLEEACPSEDANARESSIHSSQTTESSEMSSDSSDSSISGSSIYGSSLSSEEMEQSLLEEGIDKNLAECIEKLALTQEHDWERTITVHEPSDFICNEEQTNKGHPNPLCRSRSNSNPICSHPSSLDWERTTAAHEPSDFSCNEEETKEGHLDLLCKSTSNGNTASSQASLSNSKCVDENPVSHAENSQTVTTSITEAVMNVWDCHTVKELLDICNMQRFIVSSNKLEELKGNICKEEVNGKLCGSPLSFNPIYGKGTILRLAWQCSNKHSGQWVSSEVLTSRNNNNVYVNDILAMSSILISGNNYTKFALLCKALQLRIPDITSYLNTQKHYTSAVIMQFWEQMKSTVIDVFRDAGLCLSGDGRNDSPGHSARYCTYILMEHFTKLIIDFNVTDKRETKGVSTNMEVYALKKLLEKLKDTITIAELITDASTSVAKLIRNMKALCKPFENIYHGMDMWHKAKSLNKKLHKAAAVKGQEELHQWIDAIVNHFWFCCQECNGSVSELKVTWTNLLHHVCGEHVWSDGECRHGPSTDAEPKTPLSRDGKTMIALREIVWDKKFLSSLDHYVRFRHTSDIENFNSMLLKYAAKRNAFEYPYYIARNALAAIDHNFHLSRPYQTTKSGNQLYARKYSKRTKRWHVEPIKAEKTYDYIPLMQAHVLKRRQEDIGSSSRKGSLHPDDPKRIAPTIDYHNRPPPTAQLVELRKSRFVDKNC